MNVNTALLQVHREYWRATTRGCCASVTLSGRRPHTRGPRLSDYVAIARLDHTAKHVRARTAILAGTIPTRREFSYADKICARIHFARLRQSSTNRNRIPADIASVRQ